MNRRIFALVTVVAVLCAAGGSWAYFTTSGGGSASASVGGVTTPPQPTIEYTPGKGEVGLNWTPGSTLSDGKTPVQGYYVTRNNGSTTSPACGTSPTSLTTSTSCTDMGVPDGTYTYRVVAVWNSFSATSSASGSVEVVIGGGGLAAPIWTVSNAQVSATGVIYNYSFTTANGGALTSVTMTVPPGTAGTPAVGTVTGVPKGGTVSLSGELLTYSFGSLWVNPGTEAAIQITGLTNTPNLSTYPSQISTKSGSVTVDSGITAAISFTNGTGTLTNPIWTTSNSKLRATGTTYTYGFTTASTASLTSVTMTVPPETAGTPAVGTVIGVPTGGTVSLSGNRLTYSFAATSVTASTAVSIEITGLTNTSTAGNYTAQITTYGSKVAGPAVPIDNATTAAISFSGGNLANPIWTTSNSQVGASGATYNYSFTTASSAALTSVTMTVPPGTGGTPAVGTVAGIPTGGSVSLSGDLLTYSFSSLWVNAGTESAIQITGLTNTPTVGSYTSQITTNGSSIGGPSLPIDDGSTAAISFAVEIGHLGNPIWTTSNSKLGATGATYAYGFTTATGASLTSVTMTVPPGTTGTPAVGAVSGVPTGGTVSLAANKLTYSFAATSVPASTAATIQITGLTNTSTAGNYTAQITTYAGSGPSVPVDNGTTAAISFSGGNLGNPIWTTSNSQVGATGVTYNYSFTTANPAALGNVTMTVPPGTAGTPAVGSVSGVPTGGTISLANDTLTYTIPLINGERQWVNGNIAATIQVTGLTNTPTVGSYTSQITTNGSSINGPNLPVDDGSTAAISFAVEIGHLGNPIWTTSKARTGATGTAYSYSFTTANGASLTSVTMTVPPGTTGTPAVGTVTGIPAAGTVSLAANKLTYAFAATSVPASTAATIQITGLTNTSTAGSYTAQITTYAGSGPSVPVDNGTTAPVSLTAGTLSNPIWTASKSQTGATGATYNYSFTTSTAAALSAVTMTVPPGTTGTPTLGTVTGVPSNGTISLANDTLTYSLPKHEWVNGTAASIQVTGLTNTSTPGNYTAQITTEGTPSGPPNIPLDNATTASVAFTSGVLTNPSWTTSKAQTGATGTAYTYSFTTATTASLASVTMTVPPGTTGTPSVGTVSGVPSSGTVSLANNTLTYSFGSMSIAASTPVSIQITGLTNTSTAGSYTSQITTDTGSVPSVPVDNASTGFVSLSASALTSPSWTASKAQAGATGTTYTYSFKTVTGAALTAVTMTVPPGTAGTPARGTVTGTSFPTTGTVSLANDTLTYSFGSQWVNGGTAVSIQITGLTNTSTAGGYTSQITTYAGSGPIDSAITAPIPFAAGALTNPSWTTSKTQTGATGAAYTYSFATATTATLSAVTLAVPPGTTGTPVVGTVKGVASGGTVSLEGNTLTYAFSATSVAAATAASIQITGLTNTSTAGSYTSQLTTYAGSGPIDSAAGSPVSLTAGALTNLTWTTSKSQAGATGTTYAYGFKTSTSAAISAVTMTVPPGTTGTPAVGTVKGLASGGTVSLEGNTLTYSPPGHGWVNGGTTVSIEVTGLTNTSTPGSYTSQITTEGTPGGPPNYPLDSGITGSVTIS